MITCLAFNITSLDSKYSLGELKQEIAKASSVVPDEFYQIKRITKDSKKQHSTSIETCKDLAHLSINNDHDETFKRVHARVLHATKEVKDMMKEKTGSTLSSSVLASFDSLPNESSDDNVDDNLTLSQLVIRGEVIP